MNPPRITIVTVCFKAERVIEKTVLSVINQTYDNWEYLIIDGASRDHTLAILEPFQDRIVLSSQPDNGLYDAMNKGIQKATGDWILFMNADDVFVDEKVVADVADFIGQHPEAEIVYGDSEMVLEYGIYPVRPQVAYLNHKMTISHQASFVKTEVLRSHPFDLQYRFAADFEQLSHFYLEGRTFVHINRMIARVEMRGGTTFDNTIASAEELYAIIASRGVDIEAEKRKTIRHKKIVKSFKRLMPGTISNPVLRIIAKYYKPL